EAGHNPRRGFHSYPFHAQALQGPRRAHDARQERRAPGGCPLIGPELFGRFLSSFGLEELQLRISEEIVVLKDADDLEQVGFLVITVDLNLVNQVLEHGAKRNDSVNTLRPKEFDTFLPCLRAGCQGRHYQDFGEWSVLTKRPCGV